MNGLNRKQRKHSLWQLIVLYVVGGLFTFFFLWKTKDAATKSPHSNKEDKERFDKEKVFLDLARASPILDTLMAEELKHAEVLYVPNIEQNIGYQHFKDVLFAAYRIKTIDPVYYNALFSVFQKQDVAYQNIRILKQTNWNKLPNDSLITQLGNCQQQIRHYRELYNNCRSRLK